MVGWFWHGRKLDMDLFLGMDMNGFNGFKQLNIFGGMLSARGGGFS